MTQVGRAGEKGETSGFMKILVDAETKKILGASLLGIECDEVIHSILDVMYANAPTRDSARHAHPSDRLRIDPDHAGRVEAVGVNELKKICEFARAEPLLPAHSILAFRNLRSLSKLTG